MTRPATTRSKRVLRARIHGFRQAGERIAFVPTMGALHEGHLSLVRLARRKADRVVVSIFVNPTQFAPGEDFEAYPRDTQADLAQLRDAGIDLVYRPDREAMYHDDHSTSVIVGGVGDGLETDHRPTFFHGVALVVTKLLNRVQPDIAVFGEKDFQQLAVIRRLVRDLDMPVTIHGGAIARDAHGLALSSRNRYFDADSLAVARQLNRVMHACADALEAGRPIGTATRKAQATLLKAGFTRVDYVTLADAASLDIQTRGRITTPSRLLVAAHCPSPSGPVRLIDNCAVKVPA